MPARRTQLSPAMVAPVEPPLRQAGAASLEVRQVAGESAVTSSFASSPMKLLSPRARGRSVWSYTSSFGGGLVAGDQTRLQIDLHPDTRCFLGTQASTKIYRNPAALPCGHETSATVASGAVLVFAPDPVQAFAGSRYSQRQRFHLAAGSALALIDGFTSGRAARGERWAFERFSTRNEVWIDDRCVFLDSLLLTPEDNPPLSARLGRFNSIATLVLIGPLLRPAAAGLLAAVQNQPVERRGDLIVGASPLADGAVLRVAGVDGEAVTRLLIGFLQPLTELLGDNPWLRKW